MKHILFALIMLAGLSGVAGNPETNKALKTIYNMVPEPPKPDGYQYDCCYTIYYGWNFSHTCVSYGVDCYGPCAGHGWLIDVCVDGTTTIRGAIMVIDQPVKVEVPISTAILAGKFDPTLDPVSQITEYKKIENSTFNLENPLVMETEEDIFIFAAGKYQIINSKLMVLATKTQP